MKAEGGISELIISHLRPIFLIHPSSFRFHPFPFPLTLQPNLPILIRIVQRFSVPGRKKDYNLK
jgi:hypothetical protein